MQRLFGQSNTAAQQNRPRLTQHISPEDYPLSFTSSVPAKSISMGILDMRLNREKPSLTKKKSDTSQLTIPQPSASPEEQAEQKEICEGLKLKDIIQIMFDYAREQTPSDFDIDQPFTLTFTNNLCPPVTISPDKTWNDVKWLIKCALLQQLIRENDSSIHDPNHRKISDRLNDGIVSIYILKGQVESTEPIKNIQELVEHVAISKKKGNAPFDYSFALPA